MMQDLLEVQHFRPVVYQRKHDDPEGRLELRELIQIVQGDERDFPALELDDDADTLPIGFVAQIGNPFDPFIPDQLGNFFDKLGLIDLIGQLSDDQPFAIRAFIRFDLHFRAQREETPSALIGGLDTGRSIDESGRWEVGAWNFFHQLGNRDLRILQEQEESLDHFAGIVGRNVGGIAHRNAAGAVDKKIRDFRGEHQRFDQRLVVVRPEIDRILVDIGKHVFGDLGQAGFGIPHGRRRIAVDRSIIALTIHEHIAHVEGLRHPNERVVDRTVTVGVVVPHDLADNLGGLAVGPVRRQAHFVHAVENTAMNRLEAVPHVGECPADDDAHRITQIRRAHLVFDGDLS